MENILNLLQSTENLIAQADANLQSLKSMEIERILREKLQPLVEKYAEVKSVLNRQKEGLLGILVQLSLLAGAKTYRSPFGACFCYVINSPTMIRVCEGDLRGNQTDLKGIYTLAEFINCRELDFGYFCEWMIARVADFVNGAPIQQASEIRLINRLVNELAEFGKSEEVDSQP